MANDSQALDQTALGISHPAYLVLRSNEEWRDMYRLVPERVTTIGRAPTNNIVLQDDLCSRVHCEVFQEGTQWVLRDLKSRNGTTVDRTEVHADWPLREGQRIRIGGSYFCFTQDVARLTSSPESKGKSHLLDETAEHDIPEDVDSTPPEQFKIVQRKSQTRYAERPPSLIGSDRTGRDLAKLYRLALEMGHAPSVAELCDNVLEAVVSATNADIGAVLIAPNSQKWQPEDLVVGAYRAHGDEQYEKISRQLSDGVLANGEAILARDLRTDSRLTVRGSLGKIQAESVIGAPIRQGKQILGLIHLYSTNPDNALEPEDLEFTLAVADQLSIALSRTTEKESLQAGLARAEGEASQLREELGIRTDLVGESEAITELKEKIVRIAAADATVLVRGESGVGKELVARSIHDSSPRANQPFVTMNCAALSETLLESELFGHEKGSFTGATGRKFGKFEQAHGGTLFLDEVGEMGPAIQAKFLRVLEGHPFERVGGRDQVRVDVRVVAATNRDLERMVEENKFRADLYFRLNVVQVFVEPLRNRRSDIPLLATFFLRRVAQKLGRKLKGFQPDALELLTEYDWPGNVRELQNTVERTVILCQGEFVSRSDVQFSPVFTVQKAAIADGLGTMGETPPTDGGSGEIRAVGSQFISNDHIAHPSVRPPGAPLSGDAIPVRPPTSSGPVDEENYQPETIRDLERDHILATLEHTGGNKSRAAKILGIERSTLDRKLARYREEGSLDESGS